MIRFVYWQSNARIANIEITPMIVQPRFIDLLISRVCRSCTHAWHSSPVYPYPCTVQRVYYNSTIITLVLVFYMVCMNRFSGQTSTAIVLNRGDTKINKKRKNKLKINTFLREKKSYYYILININVFFDFKYKAKIVYYFDVRATQCLILVVEGDVNEKRLRTTGLQRYSYY